MAVTTDPHTSTTLQYTIPELWPGLVQEQMFADTVALNHFRDMSSYFTNGGDIANIPDFFTNTYTVLTQTTQGAEVTTESVNGGNTQLAVNTHAYIAQLFGKKDRLQIGSQYDVVQYMTRQIGGSLKDSVEDAIFALWSGLSTNTVGDTTTVITDLEIRQALRKIEARNKSTDKGFKFFFHPVVFWDQVLGVQKYYDASIRGTSGATATGGLGAASMSNKGVLYGVPVAVTTNVVSGLRTYRNLLAHEDAFCFAFQGQASGKVNVSYTYEPRNIADLLVADIIYGVKELRDELACLINANTAATTS